MELGAKVQPSASGHSESDVDGHVHFKPEDLVTHDSKIQIEEKGASAKEVHLGFLQIHHIYQVTFRLAHSLGSNVTFDPLESLLVKVKTLTPTDDGHEIVVTFNAHKEKLMKEKITLRSQDNSDNVLFVCFHARVLGKHKGTPSLREGIHLLGIEADEEDESDWQGF